MGDTSGITESLNRMYATSGQAERLADKRNAPGSVQGQPSGAGSANGLPAGQPAAAPQAGVAKNGTFAQPRTQNQDVAIQSKIQSQRQRALNGSPVGGAPPAGQPGKTALGT